MHMRTAFVRMNEYRSHDLVLHLAGGRGFQLCSVLRCGYHPYPYQSVLKRGEAKVFWRSGTCSVSTTGLSGLAQVVPAHLILNHLKLLSDCCAPSQSFGPIPAVFLLIPPHFPLPPHRFSITGFHLSSPSFSQEIIGTHFWFQTRDGGGDCSRSVTRFYPASFGENGISRLLVPRTHTHTHTDSHMTLTKQHAVTCWRINTM